MKKFIKNLAFGIGWSILILSGCTKDSLEDIPMDGTTQAETETVPQESPKFIQDSNKQVYNYIISLGFDEEDIIETSYEYLVEGDIGFAKDMIVPEPRKSDNGLTQQRYFGVKVSDLSALDITVRADPSMNNYLNQIDAAIQLWNNVNWWVKFRRITSGSAKITIYEDTSITGCAKAGIPFNGQPYHTILYDNPAVTAFANLYNNNLYDQQVRTIAHELGHCIGFAHTGTSTGTQIAGTLFTDSASIMNGGQCGQGTASLSTNDVKALKYYYTAPVVTLSPSNIDLTFNSTTVVNISGIGPVTVRLSGDPGLILFHGSSSGTSLNLTAPTTFEVHKQWGSGYSRIMLDSWGSNRDITYVSF